MTSQVQSRTKSRPLLVALKNSPALLGASAVANVYVTSILLSIEPNVSLLVVPLVAVSVYVLDDAIDREDDEPSIEPPSRRAFYTRPSLVAAVAVGGYVFALAIAAVYGGFVAVALTLVPGVAGLLYSIPCRACASGTRAKDVFLLNTTLIAGAIAVPGTLLPVVFAAEPVSSSATAALVAFWTLRYAVGVETCNAPDLDSDRRAGVSTVPTRYGITATRRILFAGDAVAAIVLVAFVAPESDFLAVAIVLACVAASTGLTAALSRPRLRELACVGWDGLHVIMGIAVAVGVTVVGSL